MQVKSVKSLDSSNQKSKAEIEEELLRKKEEEDKARQEALKDKDKGGDGIKDEDVLKFISTKTGKEVSSFDDLFKVETKEVIKEPELPEDVKTFLDYKKETGRSLKDFIKIQTDFDSMPEDTLLSEYYRDTKDGLDDSDIKTLLKKMDVNDSDALTDEELSLKRIAKKEEIARAKKHFNQMKSKYKAPLELSGPVVPAEDKDIFEQFKQYKSEIESNKKETRRKSEWFTKKTDELLNPEFKGFEFDLNGKKVLFNPGSPDELKKKQSSPLNLVSKFIGDDGLVKDPQGYHKALAAGMNPDKMAQHFFEMGQHFAKTGLMKDIKNVDFDGTKKHTGTPNAGYSVKAKSQDRAPSGRLVIRKKQ